MDINLRRGDHKQIALVGGSSEKLGAVALVSCWIDVMVENGAK